jgi:hypothetical protein
MPVEVKGAVAFKKALARYAPELKKEFDKEIKAAIKPVLASAKSRVPERVFGGENNWSKSYGKFPRYDAQVVRSGLTYSLASKRSQSGFVSLATLFNKSPVGAIIETAGRQNAFGRPTSHEVTINKRFRPRQITVRTTKDSQSNNPNAGMMMIERLNEHVGQLKKYDNDPMSRGRLLYAAYAENQGKALDAIMKAVEKTNSALDEIMTQDRWTLSA